MNRILQPLAVALLLALMASPALAQSFGGAVAIGNDAVFVSETSNPAFPGSVYVFAKNDAGDWVEQTQLMPTDATDEADRFGRALAAWGNRLVAGATTKDASTGAAYVFERGSDGMWTQAARLMADGLEEGDSFGRVVAIEGDHVLVGTLAKQAVYHFQNVNGEWVAQGMIQPEGLGEDDLFSLSIAIQGDMAFIGAPGQNESAGAVYAYRYDGSMWAEVGKLEARGIDENHRFGSAIAVSDGMAYVGAPGYSQREGGVFVFGTNDEGAWEQQTRLAPFEASRNAQFGSSLAVANGQVWVGTPGGAGFRGTVYTLAHDGEKWQMGNQMSSTLAEGRTGFGNPIAVEGPVAVVGATRVDFGAGGAIVFEWDGDMWNEAALLINEPKGYASITGEEIKCGDDVAAGFPCKDVDLVSFLSIQDLGGGRGTRMNDIWGWTDPTSGREYALVGRSDGTSFVDITDATNPRYLGDLPMTEGARASVWRDIKVYKDHAYIVADGAGDHGMQVFDLTRLRTITEPQMFEADFLYTNIASSHNIVINEATGYAYSVGSNSGGETCGGGFHMINIEEPKNPTFAGCFADVNTGRRGTGYSHDAQCVTYNGPDTEHVGKEICLGSNETALSISDMTDKDNPVALAFSSYPKVAYAHQGWLTEDHRYFYMNDEGDEPQGLVEGTRTLIWDVADLDDPILIGEYIAQTTSTDHNLYIRGNLMYQSNYESGFRILDIANPANPVEVAYFDTTPYEGGSGSWSNYPYFESGTIIVTSIGEGLFLLKKSQVDL